MAGSRVLPHKTTERRMSGVRRKGAEKIKSVKILADMAAGSCYEAFTYILTVNKPKGKMNYEYSKEDVKMIFGAIEAELRTAKAKFEASENECGKKTFSLRK